MTDEQLHAHFDAVAVELKKRLTRKV